MELKVLKLSRTTYGSPMKNPINGIESQSLYIALLNHVSSRHESNKWNWKAGYRVTGGDREEVAARQELRQEAARDLIG